MQKLWRLTCRPWHLSQGCVCLFGFFSSPVLSVYGMPVAFCFCQKLLSTFHLWQTVAHGTSLLALLLSLLALLLSIHSCFPSTLSLLALLLSIHSFAFYGFAAPLAFLTVSVVRTHGWLVDRYLATVLRLPFQRRQAKSVIKRAKTTKGIKQTKPNVSPLLLLGFVCFIVSKGSHSARRHYKGVDCYADCPPL